MIRAILSILLLAPLGTTADRLLKVPLSSKLVGTYADSFSVRERENPSAPVNNRINYLAITVEAGNHQTFPEVLIDTGSAITWVGGQQTRKYQPGPNTQIINQTFSIGYGAGGANGTAYRDQVTIGEATANSQIIGAAHFSHFKFPLIDGILGLGPPGSNAGEVSGFNTTPTFVETLLFEGAIDSPVFGLFVKRVDPDGVPRDAGEITFGGIDSSRIKGDVTWVPQNLPYNFRWEFNVTGFSFGEIALTQVAPAYTDVGVLPLEIPSDQFFDILEKYNGTVDPTNAFLTFPSNTTASTLPSFNFTVGEDTFSILPEQYLIPKGDYSALNITDNLLHSWIAPAGFGSYNFGQKFLENVYSAYDLENHRVGFAHLND